MAQGVSASPDAVREASPLSAEQFKALTDAKQHRRKLDRAATVAATGGWITAVLAALGAPFALFDWVSAVMVLGLAAVVYHEFKGRRMLKALDPAAPRLLGFNQLAVSPAFRRRGIARALVECVLEDARSRGISDVEVTSWPFNTDAHDAFRSLGFTPKIVRFGRQSS